MPARDLNTELAADLEAIKAGADLRRPQFLPQAGGALLRRSTVADGRVETEDLLTGPRWELFAARKVQRQLKD